MYMYVQCEIIQKLLPSVLGMLCRHQRLLLKYTCDIIFARCLPSSGDSYLRDPMLDDRVESRPECLCSFLFHLPLKITL